jgi:endoglucanase
MRRSHLLTAAVAATVCAGPAFAEAPIPVSPVRMNQLGFQPDAPKRAVVPDPSTSPLPWRLLDAAGKTVASGQTKVEGDDAASGEHLHLVDFSGFRGAGHGFRLAVGSADSRSFDIEPTIYDRLKYDALNYFYQTRAGVPIERRFVGDPKLARPAGQPHEVLGCFAGTDTKGNVWDSCDWTLDVTGGWYDAGDQGKYVVNGGISVWTLQDAYARIKARGGPSPFAQGRVKIPEAGDGLLAEARFELEFLMRMQIPDGKRMRLPVGDQGPGKPLVFTEVDVSGMAHQKVSDARWTPLPTRPDRDPERRFLYPPTTGATLNLAAAAAQGARLWRGVDDAFAAQALASAERAYAAATRNPEVYATGAFAGGGGYGDHDLSDEFFWAAAELYVATGSPQYLADLKASPIWAGLPALPARLADLGWPNTAAAGLVSLARSNQLSREDRARVVQALVVDADHSLADEVRSGYAIPYAPAGWPWGSNAVVLNRALVLATVADLTGENRYAAAVTDAMDYVVGRNPLDQSFVTGWGARPMRNPHHRFWAHMLDPTYPSPPPGVLSGGVNNTAMTDPVAARLKGHCAPMTCWADDTRAYAVNEVAINWNAPLVWVATWLDARRAGR